MGTAAAVVTENGLSLEPAALAHALFERHRDRVYRQCFAILRSRDDAEDALQQTFVNVVLALRSGVRPSFETAWLLTIARNVCIERQRSASRRARVETVEAPDTIDAIPSPSSDLPGTAVEELRSAVAGLDPRQRDALLLREWRGLSYREIATALDLSQSHVETLVFRARQSLGKALDGGRRLRGALGLGPLLGNLRSLLVGSTAKTACIIAGCGASIVGGVALEHAVVPHNSVDKPALPARHVDVRTGVPGARRIALSSRLAPTRLTSPARRPPDPTGSGGTSGATAPAGTPAPAIPTPHAPTPTTIAAPANENAPAVRPDATTAVSASTSATVSDASARADVSATSDAGAASVQVTTPAGSASTEVSVDQSGAGANATVPGAGTVGVSLP